MSNAALQNRNIASTFAKGLKVLEAFDADTPSLTLAELARRTGQDRATARRGALTLVELGYLRQVGRYYALTPRVLSLAAGFLQSQGFGRLVQPVLNHHAAQLGVEITLAARDGQDVLLLAQSTTQTGPISYGFTLGSRLPLLHTSLGRMLLAGEVPEVAQDLITNAPMWTQTDQALRSRDSIAARIDASRSDGFNVTDSEFEPGIVGLSVPVSVSGSRPLAIGSSTPRGRDGETGLDTTLRGLQTCAAELRHAGGLAHL